MTLRSILLVLAMLGSLVSFGNDRTGLVEDAKASNQAVLVGVSHGLPGIKIDVDHMVSISENNSYNYQVRRLEESKGTADKVLREINEAARAAGKDGTLFFYFSGHGNRGSIYLQDRSVRIEEIRNAIVAGRMEIGPLHRLVMMFDSCHSGSLLDPDLRQMITPLGLDIDFLFNTLSNPLTLKIQRAELYWDKLFIFASSTADESSLAGKNGSNFTNALFKAFNYSEHLKISEFIELTKDYTAGHHPVARLAPESLAQENLR